MSRVRLGVPYFLRTRSIDHFRRDLEDIVGVGATYLVLIVTDFDLLFFRDTLYDMVQEAKGAGLEVQLDPWGIGGVICTPYSVFPAAHPEACQVASDGSPVGRGCPTHPTLLAFIERWVDAAAALGADAVFWDEPQLGVWEQGETVVRWSCRCPQCRQAFSARYGMPMPTELTDEVIQFRQDAIAHLLQTAMRRAKGHGLENSVCLLPREHPRYGFGNWEHIAGLPELDSFGTDPYWTASPGHDPAKLAEFDAYIRRFADKLMGLAGTAGKRPHMWVLGFRIAKGTEGDMERAARVVWDAGIRDLAIWADKYGCGDNNRSGDPEAVWRTVARIFRSWRVQAGSSGP